MRFVDRVRLEDQDREALLDVLDKHDEQDMITDRYPYRVVRIPVAVQHPGRTDSLCLMTGRTLSREGMTFLHGGFLHTGAVCRIVLTTGGGESKLLWATVTGCRCVRGRVHDVAVAFREPIDPLEFWQGDPAELKAHHKADARQDKPKLKGSALCISESEDQRRTLMDLLRSAGMRVTVVHCLGAGLDYLQQYNVDVVVTDLEFEQVSGLDVLSAIRGPCPNRPIVAMTWEQVQPGVPFNGQYAPIQLVEQPPMADELLGVVGSCLANARAEAS